MFPAMTPVYISIFYCAPITSKDFAESIKQIKEKIMFLDKHFKSSNKAYFVGDQLTLADLKVASILSLLF
jgi:glutathione S-transferase